MSEKLTSPIGWDWDLLSDMKKAAWQRLHAMPSFREVAEAKMADDPEAWVKASNNVEGGMRKLATMVVVVGGGMVPEPDAATIRNRPIPTGLWYDDGIGDEAEYIADVEYVFAALYTELARIMENGTDAKRDHTQPPTEHWATFSKADLNKIMPELRGEMINLRMVTADPPPYTMYTTADDSSINSRNPPNVQVIYAHIREARYMLAALSESILRYEDLKFEFPVKTSDQQATCSLADLEDVIQELRWVAFGLRKMQQEPS